MDISAANTVILKAYNDIGTANDGYIEISSDSLSAISNDKGSINIYGQGDLILDSIETADGNIDIHAEGTIKAMNVTANDSGDDDNITLTLFSEGNIETGMIQSSDRLIIEADSINQASGTTSAYEAILTASNGIGTIDNPLNMIVNRLDVVNTNGDVYISNQGELNLVDLNGDGNAIINAGGGSIETHSPMNIQNDLSLTGDFTLSAESSDSENDNITITANITNDFGGTIQLKAGNNVIQQSGTIKSKAGKISLASKSGSIIQSGGNIDAQTVSFQAIDTVDYQGENNLVNEIEAAVETGSFIYTQTPTVLVKQVSAGGAVKITAGNILDHADDDIIDIQSNGIIELIAANVIGGDTSIELANNSVIKASTITEGAINIKGAGELTLEEVSATKGTINIVAAGNINALNILTQDDTDTGEYSVNLNSTQGGIAIGTLKTTSNIGISAGNGDVIVNSIETNKTILISSETGAIKNATPESSIKADTLSVASKTGIDIATQTSKINATVTGPGDIAIDEADDVSLTMAASEGSIKIASGGNVEAIDIRSTDGGIAIEATGDLIAKNISSSTDVSLSTTGGNLVVKTIVAENTININVTDGVIQSEDGGEVVLKAKNLEGSVELLKDVDCDLSGFALSLSHDILPYKDYILPKDNIWIEYSSPIVLTDIDLGPDLNYFDDQLTVLTYAEELLDSAYVEFSDYPQIYMDQLSDYNVEWVFDNQAEWENLENLSIHLNENIKTDKNLSNEPISKEPASEINVKENDHKGNQEKESKDDHKNLPQKDKQAYLFKKNESLISEGIQQAMMYNKMVESEQKSKQAHQTPVVKHVSVDEFRPKKSFVEKFKSFFKKS
jgi:hypothetical protein